MQKTKYKPTAKTIVTELKHYIVDSVRRIGAGRQSVATEILEATLHQLDVVVDAENPYTMRDVQNVLSISCPSPIKVELIAFGEIPEPEIRVEQQFFDAKITTDGLIPGNFFEVYVEDLDSYATTCRIDVMNTRTGETEYVTAHSVGRGKYAGFLQTQGNSAVGANFDGVLYCASDDVISVSYMDSYNASGKTEEVEIEVVAKAVMSSVTEIVAASTVPFSSSINVRVNNAVNDTVTLRNTRSGVAITQPLIGFVPVVLGYVDGTYSFSVLQNDVIELSVVGMTAGGSIQQIIKLVTVKADTAPSFEVPSSVEFASHLQVKVFNNNMPDSVSVNLTTLSNGTVRQIECLPTFEFSGVYVGTLKIDHNVALPGNLIAAGYGGVSRNIGVIPIPVEEEEEGTPDTGVSLPVVLTVNGQLFLNGSFAGSVKMYADTPTRCTIIKA